MKSKYRRPEKHYTNIECLASLVHSSVPFFIFLMHQRVNRDTGTPVEEDRDRHVTTGSHRGGNEPGSLGGVAPVSALAG